MEGMENKVVSECFELKGKHALLALTPFVQNALLLSLRKNETEAEK